MTSYTAIPDADIDPESPGTTTLFTRIRDNPIAMFEKAPGAPVLANSYVVEAMLAASAVTNAKLQPPTAGTGYLIRRIQEATVTTGSTIYSDANLHDHYSETKHLGCTCLVAGTITAYGEHKATGDRSYFRVLKNGVLVQQWTVSSSGSFTARQVNITVAVGDVIVFQHRIASTPNTSTWQHLRIYSNNPNFAVA